MSLERLRKPLLIGVPVLIALGLCVLWLLGGRTQSTDDAYVRAAQVTVSANISGRVLEVAVHDNQKVHQGEVLFRIDDRPFRIAVEEARARVDSARLSIEALKATYRQRQADEHGAQDELAYAQREYDRQNRLLKSGIASQAQVDRALQALNAARQRGSPRGRQQGTSTRADLDNDPDIQADRHPTVQLTLAELAVRN